MEARTPVRAFLVTGALSSFVALLVVKALGLFESIMIARILGSEEFGLLSLVLSLTGLSATVAACGIPSAVTKFLSGEASGSRQAATGTLRVAVLSLFELGIFSTALFVAISYFVLAPSYRGQASFMLLGLGVGLAAMSAPILVFSNALLGMGKVTAYNVCAVLASSAGLALAVILSIEYFATGAVVAYLIAAALPGLFSIPPVLKTLRKLPSHPDDRPIGQRSLVNYGLPTLFSGFIVVFSLYWVNSYLAVSRGLVELGTFSVALALANMIAFLPSAVGVPLVPLLSSLSLSDPDRARTLVPQTMRVMIFLCSPLAVTAISFSGPIVAIAYGPEFADSGPLLSLLAVSSVLVATVGVIGNHIAGTGKMWWGLAVNMIWALVVTVSASLLVPVFGAYGASLAIVFGYGVLLAASLLMGKAVLRIRFTGLRIPAAWALCVLLGAMGFHVAFGSAGILGGLAVVVMTCTSGLGLLNAHERGLAKDILALLRIRRKAA